MEIDSTFLPNKIFVITGKNGSGKTRLLEKITKQTLMSIVENKNYYDQLICLSGTILDRFPNKMTDKDCTDYIYYGKKTNTNMFSEIAPFRIMLKFLLQEFNIQSNKLQIAHQILKKIGFSSVINLKFRSARNTKNNFPVNLKPDKLLNLENPKHDKDIRHYIQLLNEGTIHLTEISFQKTNKFFNLMEISSGERSYILTMLGLIFSIKNKSLIIYDEPENSLHPQWQIEIIRDMWQIISKNSENSSLVIATHSPLIISGTINQDTFILDLEFKDSWVPSTLYGNTSDSILKEQFGIISPRSFEVISLIQDCLQAVIDIEVDSKNFLDSAEKLFANHIILDQYDPLYETFEQIKTMYERYKCQS